MAFLGLPCRCGWALDELNEGTVRVCSRCNRRWEFKEWWVQVTPRDAIRSVNMCRHKREVGEMCPHCPDQQARARV